MSRNTISDKKEIAQIFRHGRRQRGDFFTLIFQTTARSSGSFVISIAKKSLPHAVDRNFVRRRAQNVFKEMFHRKKQNYNCVAQFNAKEVKNFQEIKCDLKRLLSNIK